MTYTDARREEVRGTANGDVLLFGAFWLASLVAGVAVWRGVMPGGVPQLAQIIVAFFVGLVFVLFTPTWEKSLDGPGRLSRKEHAIRAVTLGLLVYAYEFTIFGSVKADGPVAYLIWCAVWSLPVLAAVVIARPLLERRALQGHGSLPRVVAYLIAWVVLAAAMVYLCVHAVFDLSANWEPVAAIVFRVVALTVAGLVGLFMGFVHIMADEPID